jgi:hypothetical protein
MTTMKVVAGGLVLIGALAGVARAQVSQPGARAQYIGTGLFTVGRGEAVNVHVSLDDHAGAPSGNVIVQILDTKGGTVARRDVTLLPGQSTTLQVQQPGTYRVHSQTTTLPFPLCERRTLIGNAEIYKLQAGVSLPVGPDPSSKVIALSGDPRGCDQPQ